MADYRLNMSVMGHELTVFMYQVSEVSTAYWPQCQYCRQELLANTLSRYTISKVTEGMVEVFPDTLLLEKICCATNKAMLVGKEPCYQRTCQRKHADALKVLWKKMGIEGGLSM